MSAARNKKCLLRSSSCCRAAGFMFIRYLIFRSGCNIWQSEFDGSFGFVGKMGHILVEKDFRVGLGIFVSTELQILLSNRAFGGLVNFFLQLNFIFVEF